MGRGRCLRQGGSSLHHTEGGAQAQHHAGITNRPALSAFRLLLAATEFKCSLTLKRGHPLADFARPLPVGGLFLSPPCNTANKSRSAALSTLRMSLTEIRYSAPRSDKREGHPEGLGPSERTAQLFHISARTRLAAFCETRSHYESNATEVKSELAAPAPGAAAYWREYDFRIVVTTPSAALLFD